MKLGKKVLTSNFILILLLGIFFSSCYKNNTASIIIDLRSTGLAKVSEPKSFIDRIINFLMLSREANAATPLNITSYQLNISSSGMNTITADYPANISSIEMEVPAGKNRIISLTANIDSSDTRAVLAYTGTVTVNLDTGETKNVSLSMMTSETKIIVPDYLRNRIIQIDDMTGSNWKVITVSNLTGLSLPANITPYDTAFDAQGRIYVTNNESGSYTNLYRIDYIPSSGTIAGTEIVSGKDVPYIRWVSIDMKNSKIYFATSTVLYSKIIGSASEDNSTLLTPGATIYGINVDDEGYVYIVYSNNNTTNIVAKYNPTSFASPVAIFNFNTHYGINTYYPRDVVFKAGNVYVAVAGNSLSARMIVQLNASLQFVKSYGSGATGTSPGQFFGPCQFVATLNRKLYIIDDGDYDFNYMNWYDKLISMDDIEGTNWSVYGTRLGSGSSTNQFYFYYNC